MMIQLKSFTKDAASRTKGLQLKTKLEHAIKEERNISVDFDGIDKQTPLHLLYLYFQYETDKNHNTYKHNRFGKTFGYVYNKNCIAA